MYLATIYRKPDFFSAERMNRLRTTRPKSKIESDFSVKKNRSKKMFRNNVGFPWVPNNFVIFFSLWLRNELTITHRTPRKF